MQCHDNEAATGRRDTARDEDNTMNELERYTALTTAAAMLRSAARALDTVAHYDAGAEKAQLEQHSADIFRKSRKLANEAATIAESERWNR